MCLVLRQAMHMLSIHIVGATVITWNNKLGAYDEYIQEIME